MTREEKYQEIIIFIHELIEEKKMKLSLEDICLIYKKTQIKENDNDTF